MSPQTNPMPSLQRSLICLLCNTQQCITVLLKVPQILSVLLSSVHRMAPVSLQSAHLSLYPNSDSLRRHCSTSISLYGPRHLRACLIFHRKKIAPSEDLQSLNMPCCHPQTNGAFQVVCHPQQYIKDFLVHFPLSLKSPLSDPNEYK